jgi:ferredoxin
MSQRVDLNFVKELKEYGAVNTEACFNCGNCTAICPLSGEGFMFPRDTIRLTQLGLKAQILESTGPWQCYYCGDCSTTCPRGAEPAETQMALRRWLTAQYDWTGLARRFYTSPAWEIGANVVVAVLVALGFVLFHGPVITDHVALNSFAPVEVIHLLDLIMAGGLAFFLLTNALRMHHFVMGSKGGVRAPISIYISEAWSLIYHFVTQANFSKCEDRRPWFNHLILLSGYVTMLILVVLFLPWFQTDNTYPIWHPQRWLGYYATGALFYGAGAALWGRIKKERQMHRFSHLSDWLFPILLLTGAGTGILVHIFRYMDLPMATYIIYVIHLSAMVPMLVLEVPFGKWSHLAYRPLAIYLERVQARAAEQSRTTGLASAGTD